MRKKNFIEEENIGIRKCITKSPIVKYNQEVRGWTSSSKNPELPPDTKKEENRLEKSKRKKERAALEWYDLDMQAELKSFMYIDF